MVGSHVRLGYVRYRQGRYDSALASFAREQAFLAEHDHALKGRLQIEILQKQGAAHWRKGDREAADRAFAEMMKAFRARQSRGADDPFTKYYVASLCALRGEVGRRAALSRRLRGCPAGADAGPRPARSRLRRPAGRPGLPRPGRRRCRRRASAGGGCLRTVSLLFTPRFTASWRRRLHKESSLTFKTLSFTTALVLASTARLRPGAAGRAGRRPRSRRDRRRSPRSARTSGASTPRTRPRPSRSRT